jgi:hypothetical protein
VDDGPARVGDLVLSNDDVFEAYDVEVVWAR